MSAILDSGTTYLHKCTGLALETAGQHQEPQDITLFTGSLSPFGQRVWMTLEYFGIPYKYYESNPFDKGQNLLELSPKGLVPALKLNAYSPPRAINESTVILQYLEDGDDYKTQSTSALHESMLTRAHSSVYNASTSTAHSYLPSTGGSEPAGQAEAGQEFRDALHELMRLLEHMERELLGGASGVEEEQNLRPSLGLWVEGGELGLTDVMAGPWLYRAGNMLKHFRGFEFPPDEKLRAWLERLFNHPVFKMTCNDEHQYIEGYKRKAHHYHQSYINKFAKLS